jgi:hypothetical protein
MYDPKCHELASSFLEEVEEEHLPEADFEKKVKELAQEIQDTIEAFISSLESTHGA